MLILELDINRFSKSIYSKEVNVKKVSIADVAKVAGVYKSTVSQYLNKRFHFMGEDTKYKITQAIEDLNYKPNYIARSLKQKKTSTIGVIVANISHSFSTQIIQAIESYCQLNQFHVIVSNADDSPEKEKNHIEMRSEEHTSELQSRFDLVCRLLLEKKKKYQKL